MCEGNSPEHKAANHQSVPPLIKTVTVYCSINPRAWFFNASISYLSQALIPKPVHLQEVYLWVSGLVEPGLLGPVCSFSLDSPPVSRFETKKTVPGEITVDSNLLLSLRWALW